MTHPILYGMAWGLFLCAFGFAAGCIAATIRPSLPKIAAALFPHKPHHSDEAGLTHSPSAHSIQGASK